MSIQLPDIDVLKNGFKYPESFIRIVKLNLVDLDLWYIMDNNQALSRYEGMKNRYPNRILIPFARRDDNDDVACFEFGKGEEVQIIHDFASPGYEQRKVYSDFWSWFRDAIDEMINFI
ncbi:hypothetical protein [Clostridium sp. HMP27]|uniref:hypothetical protein n=1 Tax=Clostridium sp. HMP27 TaxID=1487921 RepID=UPI00052D1498|nr:hypothetical protein [Clostridium sp. HMP27]KGK81032.1 hypothetical protein DP68_18715 [Clostridium sp. HMP27]